MELNKDSWNAHYVDAHTPWDASSITRPLKEFIDGLSDKNIKILIPGAGNAHEGEYLFRKGFKQVYICDWAPNAFDGFQKRLPDFPKDHLIIADFFNLEDSFDLIIEQTFFCAIDPSLRTAYAKQMAQLLNAKGMLAGLLFEKPFDLNSGPPFGGDRASYQTIFSPFFKERSIEPCLNSIKPRMGKELFMKLSKPIKN